MAEDHQWRKYAHQGSPLGRPCWAECAALRRDQLDDSGMGPVMKRMKAGHHPKPKDDIQANKYGTVVPFATADIDLTGRPHWSKGARSAPRGFSG